MPGKHESTSSTRARLNMGTRALRVIILVAAIVVGVLVIKNGFASNPDRTLVPRAGQGTHASGPTPTPKATRSRQPRIRGTVVRVLNGTHQIGAANSASQTLMSAGFTTRTAGNTAITNTTAVYYRSDSLASAELLKQRFFPNAPLRQAPASLLVDADGRADGRLQLVVVIGTDFLSPSPSISS
jgi:hypothetical protein